MPQKSAGLPARSASRIPPVDLGAHRALNVLRAHDRIQILLAFDENVPELPAAVRPRRARHHAPSRQGVARKQAEDASRRGAVEQAGIARLRPKRLLDIVIGRRIQHRAHGIACATADARVGVDRGMGEPARVAPHVDAHLDAPRRAGAAPTAALSELRDRRKPPLHNRPPYLRNGMRVEIRAFSDRSSTTIHNAAAKNAE